MIVISSQYTPIGDFHSLLTQLSSLRNSCVRSRPVALGVFLVKFRLGLSNTVLASMFHLKGKRQVSAIIHAVRLALSKDFVPLHLGFQHIDRQTVLRDHQTAIATQLMTDSATQVVIVMDGTYLFVQKSNDNLFQRRSFSMHKHRNLIKPMSLTATVSYRVLNPNVKFAPN